MSIRWRLAAVALFVAALACETQPAQKTQTAAPPPVTDTTQSSAATSTTVSPTIHVFFTGLAALKRSNDVPTAVQLVALPTTTQSNHDPKMKIPPHVAFIVVDKKYLASDPNALQPTAWAGPNQENAVFELSKGEEVSIAGAQGTTVGKNGSIPADGCWDNDPDNLAWVTPLASLGSVGHASAPPLGATVTLTGGKLQAYVQSPRVQVFKDAKGSTPAGVGTQALAELMEWSVTPTTANDLAIIVGKTGRIPLKADPASNDIALVMGSGPRPCLGNEQDPGCLGSTMDHHFEVYYRLVQTAKNNLIPHLDCTRKCADPTVKPPAYTPAWISNPVDPCGLKPQFPSGMNCPPAQLP